MARRPFQFFDPTSAGTTASRQSEPKESSGQQAHRSTLQLGLEEINASSQSALFSFGVTRAKYGGIPRDGVQ
jgi:hypothetical protein